MSEYDEPLPDDLARPASDWTALTIVAAVGGALAGIMVAVLLVWGIWGIQW